MPEHLSSPKIWYHPHHFEQDKYHLVPAGVGAGFVEALYAGEVYGRSEGGAEGGVGVVGFGVVVIVAVSVAT